MLYAFDVNRAFGRRLRECRERAGISQADLATKADIRRTTIANIEAGGQATSLFQLFSLAGALDVRVEDLLPQLAHQPDTEMLQRLQRHTEALLTT